MKESIYATFKGLKHFFNLFLPKGKLEISIFFGLFAFYMSYSLYLIFRTYLIDHPTIETDLYFSFDNPLVYKYGRTQISGHPLMYGFFFPLVFLGDLLASVGGMKMKTLLLVLFSASMISMSCVYINRYIREIIQIKVSVSVLLTLFYAFFFTNLILCFTPESFTLSAFFLSFSVYYYSAHVKNGTSPSNITTILVSNVFLGGITITNVVKGIIPILFIKEKKINILKKLIIPCVSFAAIIGIIHILCLVFLDKNYIESIFGHRQSFTPIDYTISQYAHVIYSYFYGAPIFVSDLVNATYYDPASDYTGNMISESAYTFWWQYTFSGLLLFLVLFSLIKNCKNKFVQMIFLLLGFDILLHCILHFGLFSPFIYGAHWLYCLPLLLGWLYKSLSEKTAKGFTVILACMFVILVINNLMHLSDFINLAVKIFPIT